MTDTQRLIRQIYTAFNERDIDACLAGMADTVDWPKASEGGRVKGKEEVRAYWLRQWKEFDPHVDPVHIAESGDKAVVGVHQVVRSVEGELLADQVITHIFTVSDGLISRMDVGIDAADEKSSAFRRS